MNNEFALTAIFSKDFQLSKSFLSMDESEFFSELTLLFEYEINQIAAFLVHEIFSGETTIFFNKIKEMSERLTKNNSLKIDKKAFKKAEWDLKTKDFNDINFILPWNEPTYLLSDVFTKSFEYLKEIENKIERKPYKGKPFSSPRTYTKYEFYRNLCLVEIAMKKKLGSKQDDSFKRFVEENVLQYKDYCLVLRDGERTSTDDNDDGLISYDNFRRSFRRYAREHFRDLQKKADRS
ncbi:MAG: hypothetical protein V4596_14135 [Bdellovibrionota bacterium]